MAAKKAKIPPVVRTSNEVRTLMLRYFYERHCGATSARGKKGFAVKISDIKRDLKAAHGLSQQEVVSNLSYLMSQGWIDEEQIEKSVALRSGTVIPQSTSYYKINARGIDKIEGEGEFTTDRFKGIKIEATGQNIITVGDGNQVNAQFKDAAGALVELKQALLAAAWLAKHLGSPATSCRENRPGTESPLGPRDQERLSLDPPLDPPQHQPHPMLQ